MSDCAEKTEFGMHTIANKNSKSMLRVFFTFFIVGIKRLSPIYKQTCW